jgi:geranylgeranylglycerol-phosphate geranylgeranyltransferase
MAAAGVWLGGYLSYGNHDNIRLVLASFCAALVCAAGNALNDFLDMEVDRKNHPGRVLPSGVLPSYVAVLAFWILNGLGIILALFIGLAFAGIVVFAALVLVIYNFRLKKTSLWGNLAVSLLGALTFVAGGMAVRVPNAYMAAGTFAPAVFAFLFHLGREMLKDLADFDGDLGAQYKTLPTVFPALAIEYMIMVIYVVVILLTIMAMTMELYRPVFIWIVLVGVDVPLMILLVGLKVSKYKGKYALIGQALKALMVVGLIAFLAGRP